MNLNLKRSSWKRFKFGDLVANINDYYRPESDGSLPYVAGPHIDAGSPTVSAYGSTDDPKFPPTFKRKFQRGDVLLHSRGIEKLANVDRLGVTGEKLFVLRSIDDNFLSQSFLLWLLMSPSARQHMADNFTGSVNKFLNWGPLASFEFDLPPIDEQKRIADLLWAIERHKLALAAQSEAARELIGSVAAQRFVGLPLMKRLGDLATTRSGPSFAAADVHNDQVAGSIPVMGIPNTKPNGTIDLEGVGYITGLPDSVGQVDNSSLILIRTNGNRQRIGNVYLPPVEAHGHAVSAFQFLMQVKDSGNREFLFSVLREPGMQRRMSNGASGTVGLGNLAVRWLNEQPIPWSDDPADRLAIVQELTELDRTIAAIEDDRAALVRFRDSLLSEMFGCN